MEPTASAYDSIHKLAPVGQMGSEPVILTIRIMMSNLIQKLGTKDTTQGKNHQWTKLPLKILERLHVGNQHIMSQQ